MIEKLIASISPFIYALAAQAAEQAEAVQAGLLGAIEAAQRWDPKKGPFSTFAIFPIKFAMFGQDRKLAEAGVESESDAFPMPEDEPDLPADEPEFVPASRWVMKKAVGADGRVRLLGYEWVDEDSDPLMDALIGATVLIDRDEEVLQAAFLARADAQRREERQQELVAVTTRLHRSPEAVEAFSAKDPRIQALSGYRGLKNPLSPAEIVALDGWNADERERLASWMPSEDEPAEPLEAFRLGLSFETGGWTGKALRGLGMGVSASKTYYFGIPGGQDAPEGEAEEYFDDEADTREQAAAAGLTVEQYLDSLLPEGPQVPDDLAGLLAEAYAGLKTTGPAYWESAEYKRAFIAACIAGKGRDAADHLGWLATRHYLPVRLDVVDGMVCKAGKPVDASYIKAVAGVVTGDKPAILAAIRHMACPEAPRLASLFAQLHPVDA